MMTDLADAEKPAEDELEVDIVSPEPFPWETYKTSDKERRRAFIFSALADWQVDGKILAQNCWVIEQYLETGELKEAPQVATQPAVRRSKL